MKIARIVDGQITVGEHTDLFPNTSFPDSGPSAEFIAERGALLVIDTLPHDPATHRLASIAPVLDGGAVRIVTVEAIALPELQTTAVLRIDADADAIYGAVIGNRGEEYRTAESEASAFIAGGYTGDAPPSVAGWATAKGWTAQQAADDIAATAAAWRGAQAAIRAQRLLRKEQVRSAADSAALDTALAAWGGFAAAVRQQLGLGG